MKILTNNRKLIITYSVNMPINQFLNNIIYISNSNSQVTLSLNCDVKTPQNSFHE